LADLAALAAPLFAVDFLVRCVLEGRPVPLGIAREHRPAAGADAG